MKIYKSLLLLFCLIAIGFSATITLQQGLNGYSGCEDTHLESTWDTDFVGWKGDYSDDVTLGVAHDNYLWLGGGW